MFMTIFINHSVFEIDVDATIADALVQNALDGDGIAVALDNKVVPRDKWNQTRLYENAKLTVIRAVCGG